MDAVKEVILRGIVLVSSQCLDLGVDLLIERSMSGEEDKEADHFHHQEDQEAEAITEL